jgi:hypothetical protein
MRKKYRKHCSSCGRRGHTRLTCERRRLGLYRSRQIAWQDERAAAGLCRQCGKGPLASKTLCGKHLRRRRRPHSRSCRYCSKKGHDLRICPKKVGSTENLMSDVTDRSD